MKASVSWIAEFVDLPQGLTARELGDALVRVGLEVERVSSAADGITGPVVLARVVSFAEEAQKNGKVIRWCSVDVGETEPRGIVCGAGNFAVGDLVVAVLPGAVLPGPFPIASRKTYGHVSDGMICSARELGLGEDHSGIMVLPDSAGAPGDDALAALGLSDAVLDIAVTPDRGYCLSVRGLAREAAAALGVAFHDVSVELPVEDGKAIAVTVDDVQGCSKFSARVVTGLDPSSPTPDFMASRLRAAGMRSISLAVDVTNYVMLETGQPLHAFDRTKLSGGLGVRRARPGETLITLDDVTRILDEGDLVVTDDRGPVALAGVMGGASTEIGGKTSDIVLEAAHWNPATTSRTMRRQKLSSEASKRFERGVDPDIAGPALQRCVDLLSEFGGATAAPGYTVVGVGPAVPEIQLPLGRPGELAGLPISPDEVRRRLVQVGCELGPNPQTPQLLLVRPPSWRPDLTDPADLVEEVLRLIGYDKLPSTLPSPPPGRGLTEAQRLRRTISRALAADGYTEVISYPFVSPGSYDLLGLPESDDRRRAWRLANPLSEAEPDLRTSLLPGLLANLQRNLARSNRNLAIFEMGLVYLGGAKPVPGIRPSAQQLRPSVFERPSEAELQALYDSVPEQPRHVAIALAGELDLSGWWGDGRPGGWADAIEAARTVAAAARVELTIRPAQTAPWHPGRCAELLVDGRVIGGAGELHPRVVEALQLPARTAAMELNLDALEFGGPAQAPALTPFPPVLLDVALVVPAEVTSVQLGAALRAGAGPLLESIRLFDVFTDADRLGADKKSLAFALRFRADDRTLTVEEATGARDAAIAVAAEQTGAVLRH